MVEFSYLEKLMNLKRKIKITKLAWETKGVREVKKMQLQLKVNQILNKQQKIFLLLVS